MAIQNRPSVAHQNAVEALPESERYYSAIGRFLVEFSYLETVLKVWIAETANLGEIFRIPIITHDFAMLCTIGSKVFPYGRPSECQTELKLLIKRLRALNDERVRIAHGWWIIDGPRPMVEHVARTSLSRTEHFTDPQELAKYADEATEIVVDLFMWNTKFRRDVPRA